MKKASTCQHVPLIGTAGVMHKQGVLSCCRLTRYGRLADGGCGCYSFDKLVINFAYTPADIRTKLGSRSAGFSGIIEKDYRGQYVVSLLFDTPTILAPCSCDVHKLV